MDDRHTSLILQALGRRIRELRNDLGYSQEAFADLCGVHRTFMGTVERGESNLSFSNVAKVAEALGVSLSTLFLDLEGTAKVLAGQGATAAKGKKRPIKAS